MHTYVHKSSNNNMQQDNANNKTSGSCPRFLFTIPLLTSPRIFFIFSSSAPSSSPDHPTDLQGCWAASPYDKICTACSTELAVKFRILSMGFLHLVHLLTRSLSSTVCLQL